MAAEGIEVTIQLLDVDGFMGSALCSVHQHGDTMLMSFADDGCNGIDRSQHVADVGNTDDFRPFTN